VIKRTRFKSNFAIVFNLVQFEVGADIAHLTAIYFWVEVHFDRIVSEAALVKFFLVATMVPKTLLAAVVQQRCDQLSIA